MGPTVENTSPVGKALLQTQTLAPKVEQAIQTAKNVSGRLIAAVPEDALTETFRRMAPPDDPMPANTLLKRAVDEPTGRVIGRIVDMESGDLVRQIPSDEMLQLIAKTKELFGQLVNEKV